jgi:uncharacterized SAM-binding protein YcdF (DUF218 family)
VFNLGIVFGAPLVCQTVWEPSRHLELRIAAAAEAYHSGEVLYLILVGGHNVGVRYGQRSILEIPNFSFQALARAHEYPSEAEIMFHALATRYDVPNDHMLRETLSATTKENVAFLEILLQRTPVFEELEKVKLITQLYHMPVVLEEFREARVVGEPLFVEDLLHETRREDIIDYYRDRRERTKNPFPDVERLAQLMQEGRSVIELL